MRGGSERRGATAAISAFSTSATHRLTPTTIVAAVTSHSALIHSGED